MQIYACGLVVFNSIAHLLVVKEEASLWEYGWLQLPFCSKPSDPKLLEVVLIMALAECMFSGRTKVLLPTPGCIALCSGGLLWQIFPCRLFHNCCSHCIRKQP